MNFTTVPAFKRWIKVVTTKNKKIVHSIEGIRLVALKQKINFCTFKTMIN
jgi:hypothetical protein